MSNRLETNIKYTPDKRPLPAVERHATSILKKIYRKIQPQQTVESWCKQTGNGSVEFSFSVDEIVRAPKLEDARFIITEISTWNHKSRMGVRNSDCRAERLNDSVSIILRITKMPGEEESVTVLFKDRRWYQLGGQWDQKPRWENHMSFDPNSSEDVQKFVENAIFLGSEYIPR